MRHILLVGSLILAFLGFSYFFNQSKLPLIGVTQIIDHPAIDQEREGMVERLKELGFIDNQTIRFSSHSAQGSVAMASQIVSQFASDGAKMVVAFSTPSAQSALPICLKMNIPLVFSTVSDPSKILSNSSKENITGVSDGLLAKSQVDLIQSFIPEAKTIGILYNPGESNSTKSVEDFKIVAKDRSLTVLEGLATKTSDVSMAVTSLIGKVDVFYVPNDNTCVSSMVQIVNFAKEHKVPVFAGDVGSVELGAVAMRGYDRRELGRRLGDVVAKVLNGSEPKTIPVVKEHPMQVLVNKESLKAFNLTIPKDIEKEVKLFHKIEKTTVAITSIVKHPSLEKIENGIIDILKSNGIGFVYENANGTINMANVIAQNFISKNYDVLAPITTPSTVAMYHAASKVKKPVIFVAVSDPKQLSIQPNDLVSGLCDFPPVEAQTNLIASVATLQKTSKIGILYNASEANSVSITESIKSLLIKKNLQPLEKTITSTTELSQALKSLVAEGIGVLFLSTDNTVISGLPLVIELCHQHKIPIVCSDPESVEKGCLAAIAFDQYDIGQEAGKMIVEYLKTKNLPKIRYMPKSIKMINLKTLKDLYPNRSDLDAFSNGFEKKF